MTFDSQILLLGMNEVRMTRLLISMTDQIYIEAAHKKMRESAPRTTDDLPCETVPCSHDVGLCDHG